MKVRVLMVLVVLKLEFECSCTQESENPLKGGYKLPRVEMHCAQWTFCEAPGGFVLDSKAWGLGVLLFCCISPLRLPDVLWCC